jgi:hypothetical protein
MYADGIMRRVHGEFQNAEEIGNRHSQAPAAGHGVSRVDDEVHHDLLQLTAIHKGGGRGDSVSATWTCSPISLVSMPIMSVIKDGKGHFWGSELSAGAIVFTTSAAA